MHVRSSPSHPTDYRSLKRTKAYKNLEEIRPTLRNKSSGMKPDWRKSVKQSTPRRMASGTCSRGQPGSSSSVLSSSTAIHQSPPPDLELDHTSSMLAFSSPPIFSKLHSPPPFHGNIVPLVDAKATVDRGHGEHSLVVWHHQQQRPLFESDFASPSLLPYHAAKANGSRG